MKALCSALASPPHSHQPLAFSIDDFYLPYAPLNELAAANPTNPLLQQRGEPGTHDLPLAQSLFADLRERKKDVRIPSYDKSAHNGRGDRADESTWRVVNRSDDGERDVDVVLFEGWCAGFRALSDAELEGKWKRAKEVLDVHKVHSDAGVSNDRRMNGKLGRQKLEDLKVVNDALKGYDGLIE